MADGEPDDLTDTWQGRFTYPRGYDEPVSFVARLQQTGEWLSGTIDEPGRHSAVGRRLTSTISGKVTGDEVTFLKTYDAEVREYDAVHYAGRVGDGGLEISGTWSIPGSWSGGFIMIRSRGTPAAIARKATEKV